MTERCCSFCAEAGHNIRTCPDHRIKGAYLHLIVTWVLPRIGYEFTQEDHASLFTYLGYTIPRILLYAVGSHYCQTRKTDFVQTHASRICEKVSNEHAHINTLNETQRDEWCIDMIGMPYRAFVTPDPDSVMTLPDEDDTLEEDNNLEVVTFFEDRTPVEVTPYHPVVQPFLLCLESAEELAQLTECVICQEDQAMIHMTTTNCGHLFCHTCMCLHIESKAETPACPLCRSAVTSLDIKDVEALNTIDERFSRTAAILKDCSVWLFNDPMWAPFETSIQRLLEELKQHTGLVERINCAPTHMEKAEHIWRFCRFTPTEDVHSLDDFELDFDF
jgi:hypothetical protein